MNKIYKIIYSKTLGCLVVASESAKCAGGKKTARRNLVSMLAVSSLLSMPVFAGALPTGGQVVSGAASISSNGSAMTVHQSTDKMIANWQSFSIGADHSVTFNQPSASSVALNRVVGQDASQVLVT
ncbi:ESPR-type extended signal peptide-containing protein [Marinomonas primoryensis]|jgi:large exoprotein involved in heme utilization and adhesion|uniref:ESPR-type extended signal peptide-containing protein n=1 Tax=Marinomonas primoryensis TaxID=178399 RepID=A0ABV0KUX7_9GAMM